MELLQEILDIYNEARKRILLYAQASLSQSQYEAFRKLCLDEFGKAGAESKLLKLLKERAGKH